VIRLRGRGLPAVGSSLRGDEHVRIFVEVPTKLTERQRALLEEFAREGGTEVSPVTRGFLDKLRELFE
jgi:molecular chaperone DnaJ